MIKAIIGLGNPGPKFYYTRHNVGFRVLDAFAAECGADWRTKNEAEIATVNIQGHQIFLIKPQTFMNSSGRVVPDLLKRGIKPEEILVVHDELELPFGKVAIKKGGSAKGHNGVKSIIESCGPDFYRLRCGIGRPESREDVPDYVLKPFMQPEAEIDAMILGAIEQIRQAC